MDILSLFLNKTNNHNLWSIQCCFDSGFTNSIYVFFMHSSLIEKKICSRNRTGLSRISTKYHPMFRGYFFHHRLELHFRRYFSIRHYYASLDLWHINVTHNMKRFFHILLLHVQFFFDMIWLRIYLKSLAEFETKKSMQKNVFVCATSFYFKLLRHSSLLLRCLLSPYHPNVYE